jgi:hypothetical protein
VRAELAATARRFGALLAAVSFSGLGYIYYDATDFPTADPIARVDAALVQRLRESPGRHHALAPDYQLVEGLRLHEDAANRWIYGTDVDLREEVPRRAIHIQKKGSRAAIHADNYNPAWGLGSKLLHGTLDLPVIPLFAAGLLGLGLWARGWRRRPRRAGSSAT